MKMLKRILTITMFSILSFSMVSCSTGSKKPKIQVFLLAGQSNMTGLGSTKDLTTEQINPKTNVLAYADGQYYDPKYACIMARLSAHLGTQFGPELTFGLEMEKAYPKANIALIKWSYGATGLADNWNPDGTGDCYEKFKQTVLTQMEALKEKYDPVIIGMIWMQGENDASYPDQAKEYEKNLRHFFERVKIDLNCPGIKIVIGRISDSEAWPYRNIVRPAQQKIAEEMPNTAWIDTDDLTRRDRFHYDTQGQLILGERFSKAMIELLKNK